MSVKRQSRHKHGRGHVSKVCYLLAWPARRVVPGGPVNRLDPWPRPCLCTKWHRRLDSALRCLRGQLERDHLIQAPIATVSIRVKMPLAFACWRPSYSLERVTCTLSASIRGARSIQLPVIPHQGPKPQPREGGAIRGTSVGCSTLSALVPPTEGLVSASWLLRCRSLHTE